MNCGRVYEYQEVEVKASVQDYMQNEDHAGSDDRQLVLSGSGWKLREEA